MKSWDEAKQTAQHHDTYSYSSSVYFYHNTLPYCCLECYVISYVSLGILWPVPVIVAAFAQDSLPFTMVRFPPVWCIARNRSLNYFSLTFIPNIVMMVGVSLLLPVIWTVHKVYIPKVCALKIMFLSTRGDSLVSLSHLTTLISKARCFRKKIKRA